MCNYIVIFNILYYNIKDLYKYIQHKGRGKMTNIKHLTKRKVEIQVDDSKEKLEYFMLLADKYKADHTYNKNTNTIVIECETETDMLNLLEGVKKYLRKA